MRLLLLLLLGLASSAASAAVPPGTCFAVQAKGTPPPAPDALRCEGKPVDYRDKVLWLRLVTPAEFAMKGGSLVAGSTRFNRMSVIFVHPGNWPDQQTISRGNYGDHWHIGNQISFPSHHEMPVTGTWIRIEGLESYDLLRVRFVPGRGAARQSELTAFVIGGALALLAIAAAYNLGLAIALRRRFFLWHGCWAASVLIWGLVWSQAILLPFPDLAGTTAARSATILACTSIMFAALSTSAAVERSLSRRVRRLVGWLGIGVAIVGVLASVPGANLSVFGVVLAATTLGTLLAVAVAIGVAWRRGDGVGRDLVFAWALPMLVLGATEIFDFNTILWGGGAQIAVLFASAFQTICLSVLANARLSALRVERDAALATGKQLAELAHRDVLTGLLNRRGFISHCTNAFGGLAHTPFALLVIDVDKFKSVNDRFGHEAGDAVLMAIGMTLRSLEKRHACLAGRLGGDEFVVGVSGLSGPALRQFAEAVRRSLSELDHRATTANLPVTVSIGVAEGHADGPFPALYGKADRALYDAKRLGPNKVVFASGSSDVPDGQLTLGLQ